MKYCPKCNYQADDNSKFCMRCGTPLVTKEVTRVENTSEPQNKGWQPEATDSKPQKKNSFFGFGNKKQKQENTQTYGQSQSGYGYNYGSSNPYENNNMTNNNGYGNNAGYGSSTSYGNNTGYGNQTSYGNNNGYGNNTDYSNQNGYGNNTSYGNNTGYGNQTGYGNSNSYGYGAAPQPEKESVAYQAPVSRPRLTACPVCGDIKTLNDSLPGDDSHNIKICRNCAMKISQFSGKKDFYFSDVIRNADRMEPEVIQSLMNVWEREGGRKLDFYYALQDVSPEKASLFEEAVKIDQEIEARKVEDEIARKVGQEFSGFEQQAPLYTQTEPEIVPAEPEIVPAEPEIVPAEPEIAPAEPEIVPAEPEIVPAEPEIVPAVPVYMQKEPEPIPMSFEIPVSQEPAAEPEPMTFEIPEELREAAEEAVPAAEPEIIEEEAVPAAEPEIIEEEAVPAAEPEIIEEEAVPVVEPEIIPEAEETEEEIAAEPEEVTETAVPAVEPEIAQGEAVSAVEPEITQEEAAPAADNSVFIGMFSVADELRKFKELLDAGVLTEEEFAEQKKKLLALDYRGCLPLHIYTNK